MAPHVTQLLKLAQENHAAGGSISVYVPQVGEWLPISSIDLVDELLLIRPAVPRQSEWYYVPTDSLTGVKIV